jgi:hypothetical protein
MNASRPSKLLICATKSRFAETVFPVWYGALKLIGFEPLARPRSGTGARGSRLGPTFLSRALSAGLRRPFHEVEVEQRPCLHDAYHDSKRGNALLDDVRQRADYLGISYKRRV